VLHDYNKDIIGPDPASLQAGTRIRIPSGSMPAPETSWQRVGGTISGDPAAVLYHDGAAHVFATSTNGTVAHFFNGTWEDMGATPAGVSASPAATVRGGVNLHLAVRGSDTRLYHRFWNGQQWGSWEQRGGDLASAPALASWGAGRLDAFACGMFQNLIHCWWDAASGWSHSEDLSQVLPTQYAIQYAPAAASWGANRLDIIAVRAGDGHLLQAWWDGTRWNGWQDLGGTLNATPAIVAGGVNQLACFGRGTDGQVYQKRWDGARWGDWQGLGGMALASAPAAALGGAGITLFSRGTDGALWQRRV